MTLYLSRLSMARLLVYQSPGKAQEYYLDAILGRWQIDFTAFQSMCEMVNTNSAAQLLDHCKQFLTTHPKTEKLMNPITTPASAAGQTATTTTPSTSATAVAKKPADPNLKLLAILLESAHMLPAGVTTTTSITKEDQLRGETSLALFAMAAALTEAEAGVPEATRDSNSSNDNHRVSHVVNILRSMSRVYRQLVMPFSAAACLIRAGELGLQQQQDRQDLCKDLPPLPPKDDSAMMLLWDLFQALLLAMETGDFVRMQSAIHLLNRCNPASAFYQDVQTIIQVAGAVISQDNDYLHNNASYALEHLSLLIQEGNDEAKAQLLLCQPRQNNLVSPATGMDTIRKVQQLLA
ncbi:hypothetical protein B0O80DRAFT_205545 [Mortierella sp. GBAus27b]|nr:hypothetical protein B0O80DRAFT_205545 [Mortierella sp. GBAus27b]